MNANPPFSAEQWEETPVEVQAYLRALEARVAALEAAVRDLTERLQQDSRTSSRPPSSDPPPARAKRTRHEPSGRRPGGQPGHEGQSRVLLPVEEVAAVHAVKPTRCQRCQQRLHGQDPQRVWFPY